MQKKIASSLTIVAYCFNSLPVFAGHLASFSNGLAAESTGIITGRTIPPSIRFNSNPRVKRQKALREAARMLEQSQGLAARNGWGRSDQKNLKICNSTGESFQRLYDRHFNSSLASISFIDLFPKLKEDSYNGFGKIISGEFVGVELPSTWLKASVQDGESIFYMVSLVKNKSIHCGFHKRNWPEHSAYYGLVDSVNSTLDGLRSSLDKMVASVIKSSEAKPIPSEKVKIDHAYAYIRFVPDKPGVPGITSSKIGVSSLYASDFQKETARLSENFLVGLYEPLQNKTAFSLLTEDGCFPLKESAGNAFNSMGVIREDFLRDIFFKKPVSFLEKADCPFGNLENVFGKPSLRAHTGAEVGSALAEQAKTLAPFVIDDAFSTQGYDDHGASNYTDSSGSLLPNQAPPVISGNNYFGYYIGAGALAVFSVFGGAAVYHWWKAKKSKRNEAYDGVMYKENSDDLQVVVSIAQP